MVSKEKDYFFLAQHKSTGMLLFPKSTRNGELHENHLYNSGISTGKGEKHFVPQLYTCVTSRVTNLLSWVTMSWKERRKMGLREESSEPTPTL